MRYVGPQDAMPGSNLTVVWSLSKLYLTETTGPTSVAKDIYIKPQVKKSKSSRGLDGVEVDDSADANESIAILSMMRPDEDEDNVHIPSSAPPAAIPKDNKDNKDKDPEVDESRKRKSTSAAGEGTPSGSSKKKKSVIIEEDF
jgi:hypothetical protein